MKTALVTGANRGIGLAITQGLAEEGYHVFMGVRDKERGQAALDSLYASGVRGVELLELNVSDAASIQAAAQRLGQKDHALHVLVNNAGVFMDVFGEVNALTATPEMITRTFEVNTLGPLLVMRAFAPLLEKAATQSHPAQVVNISSGLGQLCEMGGGSLAYRISKTALNAVTKVFADELKERHIAVNAMCPGWVHTDMGGPTAPRTPEQGAETAIWLATGGAGTASGGFYRDKESIAW